MEVSARNRMTEEYIDLAHHVASDIVRRLHASVQFEDIFQLACIGLMDAVVRFDPDRGVKFKTYAWRRIHGFVIDELRKDDWVPRLVRKRRKEYERIAADLLAIGELTIPNLQRELGKLIPFEVTPELILELMSVPTYMINIEEDSNDEDRDFFSRDIGSYIDERFDALDNADHIDAILRVVSPQEAKVIRGLLTGANYAAIGKMLGLTESRISQIVRKIMTKKQQLLENLVRGRTFKKVKFSNDHVKPRVVVDPSREIDPPKVDRLPKTSQAELDKANSHVVAMCLDYLNEHNIKPSVPPEHYAHILPPPSEKPPEKPVRTVSIIEKPIKSKPKTFRECEREIIDQALKDAGGSVIKAADVLDLSRSALYRKIRQHDLPYGNRKYGDIRP